MGCAYSRDNRITDVSSPSPKHAHTTTVHTSNTQVTLYTEPNKIANDVTLSLLPPPSSFAKHTFKPDSETKGKEEFQLVKRVTQNDSSAHQSLKGISDSYTSFDHPKEMTFKQLSPTNSQVNTSSKPNVGKEGTFSQYSGFLFNQPNAKLKRYDTYGATVQAPNTEEKPEIKTDVAPRSAGEIGLSPNSMSSLKTESPSETPGFSNLREKVKGNNLAAQASGLTKMLVVVPEEARAEDTPRDMGVPSLTRIDPKTISLSNLNLATKTSEPKPPGLEDKEEKVEARQLQTDRVVTAVKVQAKEKSPSMNDVYRITVVESSPKEQQQLHHQDDHHRQEEEDQQRVIIERHHKKITTFHDSKGRCKSLEPRKHFLGPDYNSKSKNQELQAIDSQRSSSRRSSRSSLSDASRRRHSNPSTLR